MAIDPGTATVIAGGMAAGTSFLGASQAAGSSGMAARSQRNWEEMMYNQRYQKTVNDLRAAGLNPMLAYTQGAGNPGSGATAETYNQLEGVAANVRDAIKAREEIRAIKTANDKTAQDTKTSEAQQKLLESQSHNVQLDSAKKAAENKVWGWVEKGLDATEKVGESFKTHIQKPIDNPWKKGQQ